MAVLTINIPAEAEQAVLTGLKKECYGLSHINEVAGRADPTWEDVEQAIARWINARCRETSHEIAQEEARRAVREAPTVLTVSDPQERELPPPPTAPTPP